MQALSSCREQGLLFVAVCRLLIAVASLVGSRHAGVSSFSVWAQQLWHSGLVAPRHVESSQNKDQTYGPCIDRQILNHCFHGSPEIEFLKILVIGPTPQKTPGPVPSYPADSLLEVQEVS